MKYLLALLAIVSTSVAADTVINYDDGSTLTLTEGEKIMVTKGKLYQQRTYNSGKTIQFKEFPETTRRDYVEVDNGTDDTMEVGSHEWCKAYTPWSEGLTFGMVAWQRYCDTDNNGTYGCGDDTFDSSDEASVCPS
tara:strand:- start:137 stop:544 length:408 start_codon:yes stop_codon:yes gene_type:complete